MGLAFQIIGVLCVLFLLFIVIVAWVIKSKLSKALKSFEGAIGSTTPSLIHLTKRGSIEWSRAGEAKAIIEPLQKLGFTAVGNFEINEMAGVQLMAFTHSGHNAYAVVYEHPVAGVWVDIYSRYLDGQELKGCTYSNVHHPGSNQVDTQPNRKSVKVPHLDVDSLFARFINERPAYELEPVQPEKFAALFESAYADEMEWRKSRGGVTEDEVRRVAAATGRNVDDATVKEVQERMKQRMEEAPPAT
jgi:hypothetical protein